MPSRTKSASYAATSHKVSELASMVGSGEERVRSCRAVFCEARHAGDKAHHASTRSTKDVADRALSLILDYTT